MWRKPALINGTTLRKIPLAPYLREAVAHAAFRFTRDQEPAEKARKEFGAGVGAAKGDRRRARLGVPRAGSQPVG